MTDALKELPSTPLTDAEQAAVGVLLSQNISLPDIAALLARSPRTIQATCTAGRQYLEAAALQFSQDWVTASKAAARTGNHKPARDALVACKVIDPPFQQADPTPPGMVVQIGFALPGLPLPTVAPALTLPTSTSK